MKKKIQEYLTYLTAEYIYIPYDKEELLNLPKDKYVYNNSCLGTFSNDFFTWSSNSILVFL